MMHKNLYFVATATYDRYLYWCREAKLDPRRDARFVCSEENLRGFRSGTLWICSDFCGPDSQARERLRGHALRCGIAVKEDEARYVFPPGWSPSRIDQGADFRTSRVIDIESGAGPLFAMPFPRLTWDLPESTRPRLIAEVAEWLTLYLARRGPTLASVVEDNYLRAHGRFELTREELYELGGKLGFMQGGRWALPPNHPLFEGNHEVQVARYHPESEEVPPFQHWPPKVLTSW